MCLVDGLSSFYFQYDGSIHNNVGKIVPHNFFLEHDLDRFLLRNIESIPPQRKDESILIHLLKKSIAKCIVHSKKSP